MAHHRTDAYRSSSNDFDDQTSLAKIYFCFALQSESNCWITPWLRWWWYAKYFPRSISHCYAFRMVSIWLSHQLIDSEKMCQHRINYRRSRHHNRNYVSSVWPPFSIYVSVFSFNQRWLLHWVSVTVSFPAEQFSIRCGKIRMCNEPKLKLFSFFFFVGMLYISLDFKPFSD